MFIAGPRGRPWYFRTLVDGSNIKSKNAPTHCTCERVVSGGVLAERDQTKLLCTEMCFRQGFVNDGVFDWDGMKLAQIWSAGLGRESERERERAGC